MRVKILRNVGRLHEFPQGLAVPEEARSWREAQVVDAHDDLGKALIEQRLAEPTDEPVTPPEEMRRREARALALNNPGALAAEEMAERALERHDRAAAQAPAHAESRARAPRAGGPEQK